MLLSFLPLPLSQAQPPHKAVCVSRHVPTPAPSSRGRIMICSWGYSQGGVLLYLGTYTTPAYHSGQWWVFFCPFASSSGQSWQSTLASVSPLNWPIPTCLHEQAHGNLSHWLFIQAKAQQQTHTCTVGGRRHLKIA